MEISGMVTSAAARKPGERKEYHFKAFKTPKEVVVAFSVAAEKKSQLRLDVLCLLSILAGAYISFGGMFLLSVTGNMPNSDTGVKKLVGAFLFPVGLMMIVVCGAELFTGNVMVLAIGVLSRKVHIVHMIRNWVITWVFNYAGALLVAYFLGYLSWLYPSPWDTYIQAITWSKIENVPGCGAQFLRGVGANILVCLAVFMSTAAEDVVSKLLAVLFPIAAFVGIGFEHSVANMFTLSLGLMYGAPSDVGSMLWKNIVPVTLGNIVGGLLVGVGYWYAYVFSVSTSKYTLRKILGSVMLAEMIFGAAPSSSSSS